MKNIFVPTIFVFFFLNNIPLIVFSNNTIRFQSDAQQFGIADIDYIEITIDTSIAGRRYEAEYPTNATVGMLIPRSNASNQLVWGQFGIQSGIIEYNNIAGSGQAFIRIRFSRFNPSNVPPPVQIFVNDQIETNWIPNETGSWNTFHFSDWLPIELVIPSGIAYYHPFQNFDDDVDRIKRFSNFFTGNSGIVGNPGLLNLNYNEEVTRTGYGRSLEINYQDLDDFALYVESFKREWFDFNTSFDLNNLFPDYIDPQFINRRVDSIAFHYMLVADEPLSMKIEISDTDDNKGEYFIEADQMNTWVRAAIAIGDFVTPSGHPPFNPSKAKFMGFTFSDYANDLPVNQMESGTFFLDDIFLIENEYEKPVFNSTEDLLDYQNKVRFRYFWEAVDPSSFFILDRHLWGNLISVDGIGWQLSSYTIAHRNQWLDPQVIEGRTEQILYNLLYRCEHTSDLEAAISEPQKYASVKGIWAHFLEDNSLIRKDTNTEYSLFTNALLLSGVIVARQYFQDNASIVAKADSIIGMTDWNFLYSPIDSLMHFHWTPEEGLSSSNTDWFSEELDLAFLLGISSPIEAHSLPGNPYFSTGYRRPISDDQFPYIFSAPGTGFTYWFLQMYAPFATSTERFQNTRNAILKDIQFNINEVGVFDLTYDDRIFGHTACEGPDSAGFFLVGLDTIFISNYHAYGYCNKFDNNNHPNGTIAIYGGLATIPFVPTEAKELANYYYYELDSTFNDDFGYSFWSPIFGFPDAFHLDPDNSSDTLINSLSFNGPWLSVPRFAIDVGPMLINTDSYLAETGYYNNDNSIRNLFANYAPVADHLEDFSTIEINNTPETISIEFNNVSHDSIVASILNQGDFDYQYDWIVNDEVVLTTTVPVVSLKDLGDPPLGGISCQLILTLSNCNYPLSTTSNLITNTTVQNFIEEITIAPNPTKDRCRINVKFYKSEDITIEVHSSSGQILLQKQFIGKFLNDEIDFSEYPDGAYLLSIKNTSSSKGYILIKKSSSN